MVGVNTPPTSQRAPSSQTQAIPVDRPKEESPLAGYETYIIIAVNSAGKVDFLYQWQALKPEAARRCGDLLYHLNEGHFAQDIMKHLLHFEEKDKRKEFIRQIIDSWQDKLKSVKPAVRPLAFFRHGKMVDQ